MFDPSHAFAQPVRNNAPKLRQSTLSPLLETKKLKLSDSPSSWIPKLDIPSAKATTDGVPVTLPVFTLPSSFSQNHEPYFYTPQPEPPQPLPPQPRPTVEPIDTRRNKFKRDPKFPMAGLLREDGGIYGFLDKQKSIESQGPPLW